MSQSDDLYITMDDLKTVTFAGFGAFAGAVAPEQLGEVIATLRDLANSPKRTQAAAEAIRRLADFLEGKEPEPEPAPRGSHLKLVDPGPDEPGAA
jgi:hypothetical protein